MPFLARGESFQEVNSMATVQDRTSYWERAKEQGFDLSWLSQLEKALLGKTLTRSPETIRAALKVPFLAITCLVLEPTPSGPRVRSGHIT